MINKAFIEETNKLISKFSERKIGTHNGNLIVAKVKAEEVTAGGLVLPTEANKIKNYHNGLSRIVAVADNADEHFKPGQYVIHSHEARYKMHVDALRELLSYIVEDDLLYSVQDNEVITTIDAETMHG